MVKNTKKYQDTGGWGYALFNSEGELFPGDVKTVSNSCHACHKLVPERDYVFSESIEFSPLIKKAQSTYQIEKNISHLKFAIVEKKEFMNRLKKHMVATKLKKISYIEGDIRNFFFGGTLDEVTPALVKNTIDTKMVSGFISMDQNTFKIVAISNDLKACGPDDYALIQYEYRSEWTAEKKLQTTSFCYSKKNI